MALNWIKQKDSDLMKNVGSTVLIKFKSNLDGITLDNNETVDISWIRGKTAIHATSGVFTKDDIIEWAIIE